jgi:hypothetical protein
MMATMIKNNIDKIVALTWSIFSVVFGLYFISVRYGNAEIYRDAINKEQQLLWLIIAIIVAVYVIFLFSKFMVKAILEAGKERDILIYAIPFFGVFISCFISKLVDSDFCYYYGDEKLVWDSAMNLYPYFFVYLSEIYIISFILIPNIFAPTLVKIVMVSLIMGYVIYRVNRHYNCKIGFGFYLLCLLEPFYILGVEVHRMQWYGFIYLFVMVKLYFDIVERGSTDCNIRSIINIVLLLALLSVLRREGIYFYVLGPILLLKAYGNLEKKKIYRLIVFFIIIEIIMNIPIVNNGMNEKELAKSALLVHMLGEETLDRELVSEELSILDKKFIIENIDKYNNDMGISGFDSNYFDVPGWNDNNYYIRRSESQISMEQFNRAFIRLITKQPLVFLKSRIRAFLAAGRQVGPYNLYFPLMLLVFELLYSFRKYRRKAVYIIFAGVFIHIILTSIAMPASYYKYYYHMWLVAYTFFVIMIYDFKQGFVQSKG